MTLVEYFDTPETLLPQELVDGQRKVADAPLVSHQRIVLQIAMALESYARRHQAGEVFVAPIDVVLDPDRPLVVQPDLLLVSPAREHRVTAFSGHRIWSWRFSPRPGSVESTSACGGSPNMAHADPTVTSPIGGSMLSCAGRAVSARVSFGAATFGLRCSRTWTQPSAR
jgi:hypothetical protein